VLSKRGKTAQQVRPGRMLSCSEKEKIRITWIVRGWETFPPPAERRRVEQETHAGWLLIWPRGLVGPSPGNPSLVVEGEKG